MAHAKGGAPSAGNAGSTKGGARGGGRGGRGGRGGSSRLGTVTRALGLSIVDIQGLAPSSEPTALYPEHLYLNAARSPIDENERMSISYLRSVCDDIKAYTPYFMRAKSSKLGDVYYKSETRVDLDNIISTTLAEESDDRPKAVNDMTTQAGPFVVEEEDFDETRQRKETGDIDDDARLDMQDDEDDFGDDDENDYARNHFDPGEDYDEEDIDGDYDQ